VNICSADTSETVGVDASVLKKVNMSEQTSIANLLRVEFQRERERERERVAKMSGGIASEA
jgi:hypothetical protein